MRAPDPPAEPKVGCGVGASLLAHQPDVEKGAGCCDKNSQRRTWRQWARRNDCCFAADDNTAGKILCGWCTGAKWCVVFLFAIPLFWWHFGMGLWRWFAGGALHMLCRAMCHNPNSNVAMVVYYFFGGVPQLGNYLCALGEMLVVLCFLMAAFFSAFALSLLNPLTAIETCVELLVISDSIYNTIFANLPVALEHPGKLVSPCWFGPAYKSGAQEEPAVAPAHRAPAAVQTQVQVPVVHAAPPIVHAELMAVPMAVPTGVPLVGSSGSSSTAPDVPTKGGVMGA